MIKKTNTRILIAGIFLIAPIFGQASQIAPNPNPLHSTITVIGPAENEVDFANEGVLSIAESGALVNSNRIVNGIWSADDLGVWGYHGSIINSGSLTNTNSSNLTTYGFLSSSSILNNSGELNSGTTDNHSGYLDNSGVLTNFEGALLTSFAYVGNLAGGDLLNYGVLNVGTLSDHSGSLNNFGNLTNFGSFNYSGNVYNPGIFINQGDLSTYDTFGSLSNEGSLFNSGNLISSGWLGNDGDLTNSGTLINNGAISGIGDYTQTAGKTVINGSFSQTSIQIQGGDLSGASTITGDVTIGDDATINPGNSPGTLSVNGDFHSSGSLFFEIAGLESFDVLDINGNAFFTGGNIVFNFIDDFHGSANSYWDFFFADSISITDTINFTMNGLDAGLQWDVVFLENQGGRLLIIAVPEPRTYAMLLVGFGLMGFMHYFRRKTNRFF